MRKSEVIGVRKKPHCNPPPHSTKQVDWDLFGNNDNDDEALIRLESCIIYWNVYHVNHVPRRRHRQYQIESLDGLQTDI